MSGPLFQILRSQDPKEMMGQGLRASLYLEMLGLEPRGTLFYTIHQVFFDNFNFKNNI